MNELAQLPPTDSAKRQPKRQRRHVDHFRTSDEEHAALIELAQAAGLSVDAFCRLKILGEPGARSKRAAPTAASRLRFEHITAINRAGNLVNQGIKALHEIRVSAPDARERDRLAYELEQLRKLLETSIPALNNALAAVMSDDSEG
jgi:hypothetical protein